VRTQLVADDLEVPVGIAATPVDDLHEHTGPLDVAQERMPESRARACPFDEPRHIGEGGSAEVGVETGRFAREIHHAEVRLEGGEGVVSDLRRRRGQRGEQRRLAGIGQPDKTDVGDQPQLEADPALLARLALLGVAGGLVGRGREVDVAEATSAAAANHRGLPGAIRSASRSPVASS
jgi:hypothetical protein